MSNMNKWLWGGLGWAFFGPIGGIIGYFMASNLDKSDRTMFSQRQPASGGGPTKAGDFGLSLLVLFGSVMKADKQVLKSELEFVKQFFIRQFGTQYAQERMMLFKDILEQEYPLRDVCLQIRRNMDHPARLQMIHVLFGLSQADNQIHPKEVDMIRTIAGHLGINQPDFESIKAMFMKVNDAYYTILETVPAASNDEIKKAYRKMATKYHPDKVTHLGEDFQKFAEEKFKKVSEAYQQIKKERGIV